MDRAALLAECESLRAQYRVHDQGQLLVHPDWEPLLSLLGRPSLADWLPSPSHDSSEQPVRQIKNRSTTRLPLPGPIAGHSSIYIKRFGPLPWTEWVKAAVRLTYPPVDGAAPEFLALLLFQVLKIPTLQPVLFGQSDSGSVLVTAGLETHRDVKQLVADQALPESRRRRLSSELATAVRRMHAAGFHHQDLYLNHLLYDPSRSGGDWRLIDLGRVQSMPWLRSRWLLKDLAQLNYSADKLSPIERLRFLRQYLDRPFTAADRFWIRRILAKSARIRRHTDRHGL